MSGSFELMPLERAFVRFVLRGDGGRLLAMSRPFPSAVRTAAAIVEFQALCASPENYRVASDDDGIWRFTLMSFDGTVLAVSPSRRSEDEARALMALAQAVGCKAAVRHS